MSPQWDRLTPSDEFFDGEHVTQAKHGEVVGNRFELVTAPTTHALRRRSRDDQAWECLFQRTQLKHQAIVGLVLDDRVIQYVITMIVLADLVTKKTDL
ncbi:hypothetical protein D3C80_877530 [compost metagenome]